MIVNWTPAARNDLRNIQQHIAQDNPDAAKSVALTILAYGEALSNLPHRGREGRVADTRELVLPKLPYTIAYRVTDESVDILRVIHHARLWPDML